MSILMSLLTCCVVALAMAVDRFGRVDQARRTSVIVVLGARVLRNGEPSGTLLARTRKAVELYRQGFAKRILFSGGIGTHPPAEAFVAQTMARALGVPEEACLVEALSRRT